MPSVRCSRRSSSDSGCFLHRLVLAEAVALELMDNHPMEVLVVHGIVRAKGCGIIVVDDHLVRVWSVIGAEVGDECRDFQFRYAPVTVGSGRQVCDSPKPRANEFKQHASCLVDITQHAYSF